MTRPHYGDPFGEQRRLEKAKLDFSDSGAARRMAELEIGTWAYDAVRIACGFLAPDDMPQAGECLVFLHLDGSDNVLPKPGDMVGSTTLENIGRITSVGNHYELGPIAFAAVAESASGLNSLVVLTYEDGHAYLIAASAQPAG